MEFDSPDVEKDFPGLYASENGRKNHSRDSDYSEEEKTSCKDLLGKKREKRESKKDKGYAALEGESSCDDETKSPSKTKKSKTSFKLGKDKKDKHSKKDKEGKEKKDEKDKDSKKENKELKKECKDTEKIKEKAKKKKEPKLLKIRDKKKKNADQEVTEEKPIFGVPLHVAVERNKSHDGIEIPVAIRECIDYIEEHGLACEGIYKISGLKSKVRHLKSQYNKREKVYLFEHEPHIVASLIKQFLRDLPEPILTNELEPKFEEAAALKNEKKRVETFQKLLNDLPNCNRTLLSWVFVHMTHVINLEKRNKMSIQNISIALSPALRISHHVLQALFAYSHILFKGVEIKKYVPLIEVDSNRLSLELPDSPTAIQEELNKQENVLNNLHAELNSGIRDQDKEEKLWEIQRVVTQLKRKLRFFKQVQCTASSDLKEPQNMQVKTTNISKFKSHSSVAMKEENKTEISNSDSQTEVLKKEIPPAIKDSYSVEKHELQEKSECDPKESSEVISDNKTHHSSPLDVTNDAKRAATDHNSLKGSTNELSNQQEESNQSVEAVISEVEPSVEESDVSSGSQFLPLNKSDNLDSDSDSAALVHDVKMLQIMSEELLLLGDELRRKVFSEKMEIERLKSEILEYQQLYKYDRYSFDSTENSSSDTDDSDSDEEQMSSVLEDLIKENKFLEAKNVVLSKVIQKERETCINIKVQLKLLQMSDMKSDVNYHTRM